MDINNSQQTNRLDVEDLAQRIAAILEPRLREQFPLVTFLQAARVFVKAGGSSRFLDDRGGICVRIGRTPLAEITQALLDEVALDLYPTALPETRLRQFYAPLRAVWNFAVVEGWAKERKWRVPKKAKDTSAATAKSYRSGSAPTNYDHAAQFVSAMSPAPAMLMTALFYTGLRPIELFALEADDVDVANRWLIVRHSKTGEPRGVPIHEFLVPLFQSLLKRPELNREPMIFRTHKGQPYPMKVNAGGQLKTAISGARPRSGIKDISPYTARHTVSTQFVVNSVHPYIKDQILGHAVNDMSRRYTNVPQKPLIDAINTIEVPELWRTLPWWEDPLAWSRKMAGEQGERNDLHEAKGGETKPQQPDEPHT